MLNLIACAAAIVAELTLGTPHEVVDLRVYTYAALDPAEIQEARQLAQGLLSAAGVEATWRLCGGPADECNAAAITARTVFVHVLPRRNTKNPSISGDAIPASSGRRIAWIYVPQITEMVDDFRRMGPRRNLIQLTTVTVGHLVGLTIAHEVGHTLGLQHSKAGIMRSQLGVEEVVAARSFRLAFQPKERERMLVTLRAAEGTLAGSPR